MNVDELLSIASRAVEKAIARGIDEVEVYVLLSEYKTCLIQNNRLAQASTSTDSGIGIRVVIDKKIGFSYSNKLSDTDIEKVIENAMSVARASPVDPYWPGYVRGKQPIPTVEKVYNKKLVYLEIERLVEETRRALELVAKDNRLTLVYGGLSVSRYAKAIANSNGVEASCEGTHAWFSIELVANESGDTTPSIFEYDFSRIDLPPIESTAERAIDKALRSLHPVKVDKALMPVIFTPDALYELWIYTLLRVLKADSVVNRRSPYADKLGHQIAVESLTLIDSGVLPGGAASEAIDDEGSPRRETIVIERGILKSFVSDSYWGSRLGIGTTGNASRGSYASTPTISFTNIVLRPGDVAHDEMLIETHYGLLVDGLQGAHSSNPESGEFSVVATPAWLVERGEMKPVRGIMLAGNVYELMKRIDMVGREQLWRGNIVAPWIRFSEVRVIK